MTWEPFEDRPRPDADLANVTLTIQRDRGGCGHIVISTEKYDQAGNIFAWLMGQMTLARIAVEPDQEGA